MCAGDYGVGTNEQHKTQRIKADMCPVGGDSPVITTIGCVESTYRSLQNPCPRLHMTDDTHATGATMGSGQREQGMHGTRRRRHAGFVRLMVL